MNPPTFKLYWKNQYGQRRDTYPIRSTYRGETIPLELALFHKDYPNETLIERHVRHGSIDQWKAVLKMTANGRDTYYHGNEALNLHKQLKEEEQPTAEAPEFWWKKL